MRARGRSREIQERIKKLIVDGRLPPGAPLPTETELTEHLEASRNSIREALKALQAMGIVEIRHGFGTYVGAMSMAPMTEGLSFRTVAGHYRGEDSLRQLLELREAVEAGLMARLVREGAEKVDGPDGNGTGTDGGSGVLEELLARMGEEARAGDVRAETDRAFHSALYGKLGNSLLSEVLDAFWDAFHRVRTDLAELPQDPLATWRQHAEILAAVRAGDTGRAERAVRDHFGHIRERLRSATAEAGADEAGADEDRGDEDRGDEHRGDEDPADQAQFDDSSVTSVTAISPQPR